MADPAKFARKAVQETQFVYSKASKMQWGRGAIGGTLMTFKTYSIAYLELLHRMATQGGPEGKRAALPNSRVMIHQPLGGFQGQASDIEIHAKEILFLKQKLNNMLAMHTGQSIDRIERDTDRDNFLSADAAVEYGLVDKVLTSRAEVVAT